MSKKISHPDDSKVIDDLGGPAAVARRLGFDVRHGGTQRVQNWRKRGIPDHIKVKHPDLFMLDVIDRMLASDDTQPVGGEPERKNRGKGGKKV